MEAVNITLYGKEKEKDIADAIKLQILKSWGGEIILSYKNMWLHLGLTQIIENYLPTSRLQNL